jgi:hypothetical protein
VCPLEQLSAPRTLYISFRKAKLKRTWESASWRAKTLRKLQYKSKETDVK